MGLKRLAAFAATMLALAIFAAAPARAQLTSEANLNVGHAPVSNSNPVPVAATSPIGTDSTQMQGTAAAGASPLGNPLQDGGVGADGKVHPLATDNSGHANVNVTNTPAISSSQLPGALDGSGNLKIHEQGTASVAVGSALPAGTNDIGKVDLNSALPAGSSIVGKVGIDQTAPGTTNGVQLNAALPAGTNDIGKVDLNTAIPAGTNLIGRAGIDQTTPGTTNAVNGAAVAPVASSALEIAHVIKGGAGALANLSVTNHLTSPVWVLVLNATSDPGNGAVAPIWWQELPAATAAQDAGGTWGWGTAPLKATTGITVVCSTTGPFTETQTANCAISGQAL